MVMPGKVGYLINKSPLPTISKYKIWMSVTFITRLSYSSVWNMNVGLAHLAPTFSISLYRRYIFSIFGVDKIMECYEQKLCFHQGTPAVNVSSTIPRGIAKMCKCANVQKWEIMTNNSENTFKTLRNSNSLYCNKIRFFKHSLCLLRINFETGKFG